MYILKLGGSLLTEKKSGQPKARIAQIQRIAREIKLAQEKNNFSLVLVHGVGSFGHPRAQEYKLWQGIFNRKQYLEFCRNNLDDLTLNKILLENFLEKDLPVFPVQPSAVITQVNGKIKTFETKIIKELLQKNFIPVLYGNVVLDSALNGSVCSGDAIVCYLAKKLKAARVFFATDVDGVYTADPNSDTQAILIKKIDKKNFEQIFPGIGKSSAKTDAGGGMRGKILEIKEQISQIETSIFNGSQPENIFEVLTGKCLGTLIRFGERAG